MFNKSVQDFLNEQRSKIAQERIKLAAQMSDCDPEIKINVENDWEKSSIVDTNIKSEEKENIPSNSATQHLRQEDEHKMLRYGEYSPNNPKMRVATQPYLGSYLGLGEYEDRRQFLSDQRKADFQQYHADKVKRTTDQDNAFIKNNFRGSRPVSNSRDLGRDKATQTDIQNVNTQLIQYDLPSHLKKDKPKSPRSRGVKIDKVQIETQNNIIIPGHHSRYLDKVGGMKTDSPNRAKLMADLQSSYLPTSMGYTAGATQDDEKLEKSRRQEKYLSELRQQIEEKQMLLQKHKQEEKMEQEVAARKLESQLRDITLENKPILNRQPYSNDLPVSTNKYETKTERNYSRNNKWTENRYKSRILESSQTFRSDPTEKKITSKYTNSPPLSRRDKPPYSFNIPPNSVFANALPVKDKLNKNSKLALNINNLTTKDRHKRIFHSNSKLEESLPIPVLKAQSPVAKELINSVAVQSQHSRTSDAMRKLEDKWQIPAVQKNIIKSTERQSEGGILTQLGAIRLQLQQEQLRLDETLRKRGTSQTIVQADVHRNFN